MLNSIKKISIILLAVGLMASCSGLEIEENTTNQAIAYGSGKAMGAAITKLVPQVNENLAFAWDGLMARGEGLDIMPSEHILEFYAAVMGIMALETGDEYGLIQDLSVLLLIFGAEFDVDGEMTFIQPVPMSVLRFFEMGYDSGVMITERERAL